MSEIKTFPVLPLRDIVVFPHMVVPLFVGREKSVRALEEVMRGDKLILLATQKDRDQDDPGPLADNIAAHLAVKITDRQQLLEIFNVVKRLEKVFALMEGEISVLQVEKKIRSRVKRQMEKTQREYYLNEQMK